MNAGESESTMPKVTTDIKYTLDDVYTYAEAANVLGCDYNRFASAARMTFTIVRVPYFPGKYVPKYEVDALKEHGVNSGLTSKRVKVLLLEARDAYAKTLDTIVHESYDWHTAKEIADTVTYKLEEMDHKIGSVESLKKSVDALCKHLGIAL